MGGMKILWSVNPFQDERPLQSRCEAFLRGLGKRAGSVEPVYVSSPAEFQISLEFAVPLNERYRKVASQKLEAYLKNVRGIRLRPARVIEEPGPGLADSAQALAKYAHKAGADVLVMGTHARGGLARFVLGSYAQTFLALSRTPLVLVNLKAGVSPRLRRILFATDLSPSSKRAFKALCRLASAAGASVVLMNVLERPVYWAATRGYLLVGARAVTPGEYVEDLKRSRLIRARAFLKAARDAGVKASFRVDESSARPADVILKTAREVRADMVALAAQSSRLRARLLGSVSRDVLRAAQIPVWILHAVR